MAGNKLNLIVKALYEKTQSGKLKWQVDIQGNYVYTPIGNLVVEIHHSDDPFSKGGESYSVSITDGNSEIETITPTELANSDPGANPRAYNFILKDIYTTARRQALGVDKAIDSILENLLDEQAD